MSLKGDLIGLASTEFLKDYHVFFNEEKAREDLQTFLNKIFKIEIQVHANPKVSDYRVDFMVLFKDDDFTPIKNKILDIAILPENITLEDFRKTYK